MRMREIEREREIKKRERIIHILREKIGELSKDRQAGAGIDQPYDWVGLWRIDWEEVSLNSTDSR